MSPDNGDGIVGRGTESGVGKVTPGDIRRGIVDSHEQVQVNFDNMLRAADQYLELAIQALDGAKKRRESGAPSAEDLIEAQQLETLAANVEHRELNLRQQITDLKGQQAQLAQKATYIARRFELGTELTGALRSAAAGGNIDAATLGRLRTAMQRLDLEIAEL